MRQLLLFFVLIITITGISYSQPYQTDFIDSSSFPEDNTHKIFLSFQNQNIFKNNEYFIMLERGFTLFGSQLNTTVKYYPSSKTMIEGGIHLLYYYGSDKLNRVLPILRFQYNPTKTLHLVFGKLYGSLNHGFIEPVYRFENVMELAPEMGVQLLFNNKRIKTDAFIAWRHYLLRDSFTEQEKFFGGFTSSFKLINPEHRFQLDVPIQVLATHKGGQIDTLDLPLVTTINYAAGLKASYRFSGFIKETGASFYYLLYRSNDPEKLLHFDEGNAIYAVAYAKSKFADVYLGYWKGHQFYSPLGDPMYSSISKYYIWRDFPEREVFTFKLYLHHKIANDVVAGVRFETYSDIIGNSRKSGEPHTDISYGVYVNFNSDFFLKKLK